MSLIENPFKKRAEDYRLIFLRYQDMIIQVTIEHDKALMTFSLAGLAALAALNKVIFESYGWLSFFTFLSFVLVICTVMIGYCTSKTLIKDAQRILTENYIESPTTPFNKNNDKIRFSKLSRFLNFFSMFFFVIAVILFVTLMAFYIKGIKI